MAIKVGDSLPLDLKLKEMGESGPRDVNVGEIFKGKRVVLFAVPGTSFQSEESDLSLVHSLPGAAVLKFCRSRQLITVNQQARSHQLALYGICLATSKTYPRSRRRVSTSSR